MNANMVDALMIVAIGLAAVFITLVLVYLSGHLLIRLVNRISPEPAEIRHFAPTTSSSSSNITSKNMAIIAATVESVTQGRGKISNIQKVEK